MKTLRTILTALLFLPLLYSCTSEDGAEDTDLETITEEELIEAFINRESSCADLKGFAGGYWDFVNAVPLLWPVQPEVTQVGSVFNHSQLPISLELPEGYFALEGDYPSFGPEVEGVQVFNGDRSIMFNWIGPDYAPGQYIISEDLMPGNRFLLSELFGLEGDPVILCEELIQRDALGFPQEINSEIIQFGGFTAQIWVLTSYLDEGTTFVTSISIGPSSIYEELSQQLFLPLNYQLYMADALNEVDKDGDGYSFLTDPDDNDSNIPTN